MYSLNYFFMGWDYVIILIDFVMVMFILAESWMDDWHHFSFIQNLS